MAPSQLKLTGLPGRSNMKQSLTQLGLTAVAASAIRTAGVYLNIHVSDHEVSDDVVQNVKQSKPRGEKRAMPPDDASAALRRRTAECVSQLYF